MVRAQIPGAAFRVSVDVEQNGDRSQVTASLGERLALREDEVHVRAPDPPGGAEDPATRLDTQRYCLRGLHDPGKQGANLVASADGFRWVRFLRPARRATMPARRLERLAGFLPVIRQDPGLLVEPTRAELSDGTRNGRVDTPASVCELGVESDLLSERMPEGVLRLGVWRALEDELRP